MTALITSGEPAGIGPDIVIDACAEQALDVVVLGDKHVFTTRAALLGKEIEWVDFQGQTLSPKVGRCYLWHIDASADVIPGQLNPANAAYVYAQLDTAIEACLNKQFDALVTAPVHKAVLNGANNYFSGHTEYLQEKTRTKHVVMMLSSADLAVALVTTHLPLSQVPAAITKERLRLTLDVLLQGLKNQLGIARPQIYVAGLNPHAGEEGYLGHEEIDIISPVLDDYRDHCIGPLAADTMFSTENRAHADVFLAMYHDQGLGVLKSHAFGQAVNITLGLPFIRTSVDHGTALSLAGSGDASSDSLLCAISKAMRKGTLCQSA